MKDGKSLIIVKDKVVAINFIKQRYKDSHFVNTEIFLDNSSYRNCQFDNVHFIYNGEPMEFCDNEVRGYTISSNNDNINRMLQVLDKFGLISSDKING